MTTNPEHSFLSGKKIPFTLIVFVLLQLLLFLPLYLTRSMEGSFFPHLASLPQSLITRSNPDIFRWSLDYALIFMLCLLLQKRMKLTILAGGIAVIYFILLAFQIYYFIVWKIYGEIPVWSYDWALFQRVLPVFFKTMGISPDLFKLLLLFLAALLIYISYRVHRWMLRRTQPWTSVFILVSACWFFGLPLILNRLPHAPESNNTKSAILWIIDNMHTTFTQARVKSLPADLSHLPYEAYQQLKIKTKPNIELIFIEAYGSLLSTVQPYDSIYIHQLQHFDQKLKSNHWLSASALSNSTILGGRSWLGFTSLLSGIHIDNHPAYEKLIQDHVGYPHLINLLNHFGYETYRLNTMASFGDDNRALDSIAGRYFNNNKWTRFQDLPYQGYKYDYMGGIPDQYALNYWHEKVLNPSKQPYFLFFITLNTHAPFYLPPPVLDNWNDLDTIKMSPHKTVRSENFSPVERYSKEVVYILQVLEKYILEKGNDNTLYVLVGDHQPAGMEYLLEGKTDVYATPLHIISRDSTWMKILLQEGMTAGMVPPFHPGSLLSHEGFYSFFMATWAKRDSLQLSVPYLKNGYQ